jgi:hypothetical protein
MWQKELQRQVYGDVMQKHIEKDKVLKEIFEKFIYSKMFSSVKFLKHNSTGEGLYTQKLSGKLSNHLHSECSVFSP